MSNAYDTSVNGHLYENRIIYLTGDITTSTADHVVSRLLVLDSLDPTAEIRLYLTSYGGSVYAGLAIYDAMQMVSAPISTVCFGGAFSMAAFLLAAGEPGRRYATPTSRIMLHQVSTGLAGTTSEIQVAAENVLRSQKMMTQLLARHLQRDAQEVAAMTARDLWLSADEAKACGVIDGIAPFSERKLVWPPAAFGSPVSAIAPARVAAPIDVAPPRSGLLQRLFQARVARGKEEAQ